MSRVEKGGPDCTARTVKEETLQEVVVKAVNELLGGKDIFLPILQANIEAVLVSDSEEIINAIETQLAERQQELLRLANARLDYESVAVEIDQLRVGKQNVLVEDAEREGSRERIREMMEFLIVQPNEVTAYDEQLVRRLLEKVTVFDEKFVVVFKSGMEIEIIKQKWHKGILQVTLACGMLFWFVIFVEYKEC